MGIPVAWTHLSGTNQIPQNTKKGKIPATPVGHSHADLVSFGDSTWTTIAEMTPPNPLKNTSVAMKAPRAGPGTNSARYVDTAFSARATP